MAERLQINFEYNNIEDRLLLRISEKEIHGECIEYRFWLTRRFVTVFIQAIDKIIDDDLADDMQLSPDALEAMKKFQQEAALAKADFSTAYGPDSEKCTLVGEVPFLVTTLKVKKRSRNKYILSLLTIANEGINIAAQIDLLHTLRKMLFAAVKNAGWDLPVFRMRTGGSGGAGAPPQLDS